VGRVYDGRMYPRGVPVAIAALLALAATGGGAAAQPVRSGGAARPSVRFDGLEPCKGLEGVAVGRRGSRASFQFSALMCPESPGAPELLH
jgi:hypothetical protein